MNNACNRYLTQFFLQVSPRTTSFFLAFLYFVCVATTFLLFVAPGESYVQVWLNDVMGLLDIANRSHLGQTLYKDFHLP